MKTALGKLAAAFVLATLTFFTVFSEILTAADSFAEDCLYHRAGGTSPDIKIISIDDKSLSELGSYESWDRGMYARLVEILTVSDTEKPAVIGFDVLFDGERAKAADSEFAEACRKHGNVVTAFSYVFQKEITADDLISFWDYDVRHFFQAIFELVCSRMFVWFRLDIRLFVRRVLRLCRACPFVFCNNSIPTATLQKIFTSRLSCICFGADRSP